MTIDASKLVLDYCGEQASLLCEAGYQAGAFVLTLFDEPFFQGWYKNHLLYMNEEPRRLGARIRYAREDDKSTRAEPQFDVPLHAKHGSLRQLTDDEAELFMKGYEDYLTIPEARETQL